MECPLCHVNLLIADRQGIEIDYCPKCRGVWLDRGELEKLVELSVAQSTAASIPRETPIRDAHARPYEYDDRDQYRRPYGDYKKKKESWLGKLLDFD